MSKQSSETIDPFPSQSTNGSRPMESSVIVTAPLQINSSVELAENGSAVPPQIFTQNPPATSTSLLSAVPILPYPSMFTAVPSGIPMQPSADPQQSENPTPNAVVPQTSSISMGINLDPSASIIGNGNHDTAVDVKEQGATVPNAKIESAAAPTAMASGGASSSTPGLVLTQPRRRGRPPGAKNKKRRVHPDAVSGVPKLTKKGRGSSFSSEEALKLAKAWISQISKGDHQTEITMWGAIHSICRMEYGMDRTPESLRCAWSRLAKDSQSFLLARATVNAHKPPDATDEIVNELTQELYRKQNGRVDENGALLIAPPFKYIAAADFLSAHSEFLKENVSLHGDAGWAEDASGTNELNASLMGGAEHDLTAPNSNVDLSAQRAGTSATLAISGGSNEDLGTDNVNGSYGSTMRHAGETALHISSSLHRNRPLGLKKMKQRGRQHEEESRVRSELEAIRKELKRANDIAIEAMKRDEGIALLHVLPNESAEYKQVLNDIMKRRLNGTETNSFQHLVEKLENHGELISTADGEDVNGDGTGTELEVDTGNNCNL